MESDRRPHLVRPGEADRIAGRTQVRVEYGEDGAQVEIVDGHDGRRSQGRVVDDQGLEGGILLLVTLILGGDGLDGPDLVGADEADGVAGDAEVGVEHGEDVAEEDGLVGHDGRVVGLDDLGLVRLLDFLDGGEVG